MVYHGSDMEYLGMLLFKLETYYPSMARRKYGYLLKQILDHFDQKMNLTLKPNRNLWMYSGHDNTITGILNTLGLFKNVCV